MRSKLSVALLLLLLLGAPALITWSLIRTDVSDLVTSGRQPAGRIEGRVVGEEGQGLADIQLDLWAVGIGGNRSLVGEAHTRVDGGFQMDTPEHVGNFELHAGGEPWVRLRRRFSFLDIEGETVELDPIELVLDLGCVMNVQFVRLDGRPLGSGRYELVGQVNRGPFGLPRPSFARKGTFGDGRLELDGLPAMSATLRAEFATGDSVEFAIDLEVGRNRRRIEL